MEKNLLKRAEVVKAMDTMARCINNGDVFEPWLMCGVADGDIKDNTSLDEIVETGYCEDVVFKDLMTLFLKLMNRASVDGLYTDGIVSDTKYIEWR